MASKGKEVTAAANLKRFIESALAESSLPAVEASETEPEYTGRVLLPLIQELLSSKTNAPDVWVRGDGSKSRAYSQTFLGLNFHPDLAIGEGSTRYWCLEVKLVRGSISTDVLSKALGQALTYKRVYPEVTIAIVSPGVGSRATQKSSEFHQFNSWLNVLVLRNFEASL